MNKFMKNNKKIRQIISLMLVSALLFGLVPVDLVRAEDNSAAQTETEETQASNAKEQQAAEDKTKSGAPEASEKESKPSQDTDALKGQNSSDTKSQNQETSKEQKDTAVQKEPESKEEAQDPAPEKEKEENKTYNNKITGFVWADRVNDGKYKAEDDEEPLAGFTIYLVKTSDLTTVVAEVKTNGSGIYTFSNLEPGEYAVKPSTTSDLQMPKIGVTGRNKIMNAVDSKIYSGTTGPITVAEGTVVSDIDIGMKVKPGYNLKASSSLFLGSQASPLFTARLVNGAGEGIGGKAFTVYAQGGWAIHTGTTQSDGYLFGPGVQVAYNVLNLNLNNIQVSFSGVTRAKVEGVVVAECIGNTWPAPQHTPIGSTFTMNINQICNEGAAYPVRISLAGGSAPFMTAYANYNASYTRLPLLPEVRGDTGGSYYASFYATGDIVYTAIESLNVTVKYIDKDTNTAIYTNTTAHDTFDPYSAAAPPSYTSGPTQYAYTGEYKINSDPVTTGSTATLAGGVKKNTTIEFYYEADKATIEVQHKFEDNSTAAPTVTYTKEPPASQATTKENVTVDGVDYCVEKITKQDKNDGSPVDVTPAKPITGYTVSNPPRGKTTVIYYYVQDGNHNDIKDYTMTEKFETAGGTALRTDIKKFVDEHDNYTPTAPPSFQGCSYAGYKVGTNPVLNTGNPPAITNVTASNTYTYVYNTNNYTVSVKYIDRKGDPMGSPADYQVSLAYGTSYTALTPSEPKKVFADWKQDNGVWQGKTAPTISVPAANSTITIIYGEDKVDPQDNPGSDGVEDFKVVKKYQSDQGATLKAAESRNVNVGKTFGDLHPAITGYTYKGYKLDGAAQTAGEPSFPITIAKGEREVIYVYELNAHKIDVKYIDREGSSMGTPADFQVTKNYGTPYTAPVPPVSEMFLVDWKQDNGAWKGKTTPTITVPDANTTITIIYGEDKVDPDDEPGSDGTEDFKVTKKFETENGTTVKTSISRNINVGKTFADKHPTITGYTYKGYKLDGAALAAGDPSFQITVAKGKREIIYVYQINNYKIDVKYIDREGNAAGTPADFSVTKPYGSSYTAPTPAVTQKLFVDWKQDTGSWKGKTSPTINVQDKDTTITIVYGNDEVGPGVNPIPGPDGEEDFPIVKKFETVSGTPVKTSVTKRLNVGETFAELHDNITGYDYKGYKLDGGALVNGEPSFAITVAKGKREVNYIYELKSIKINVKYVDRKGNLMGTPADFSVTKPYNTSYTAPTPSVTGKLFVDWKQDSGIWKGKISPTITVPDANTTLTIVYGDDKVGPGANPPSGPDGIEDFPIVKKFETTAGTTLKTSVTKQLNVGETFAEIHDNITGYAYKGYKLDGAALAAGEPNFQITAVKGEREVIYIYEIASYTITVKYQDRDGTAVKADAAATAAYGSSYTVPVPAIANYVFVDWKQDASALMGNTVPKITVPAKNTTIILVYGDDWVDPKDDPGSDGVEDFKVTKKFEKADGTSIKAPIVKSVNKGKTFKDIHDTITGYTYKGYKLGSGALQTGEPSFTVAGKQTVTYIYEDSAYKVTVQYQDRDGSTLKADLTASVKHGANYTAAASAITDYIFVDWKQDNGSLKGNTSPSVTNITKDTTITLIYGDDLVDPNDDPGNDGVEDFKITKKFETAAGASVKAPEVKSINKGKTFKDAHASVTGFTYEGYKIGGGALQTGEPNFTVSGKETVTYIYKATGFTITIEYEDREGNAIQTPAVVVAPFDSTYTVTAPVITGFVYVDWKHDGGALKGNTNPSITVPAANTTVTLIYGDDKADSNDDPGSDGIEDFPVVKKYETIGGTTLRAAETKYVNKGKAFKDAHANIMGYAYKGHKIASGIQKTGEPSFTVTGKQTVTYIYGEADYTIMIKYEDREGKTIKAAITDSAKYNSSYTAKVPAISKYVFVDWKQDGGTLKGNKIPIITVPALNTTITLVYGQDKGGGSGDGKTPDGIEDYTITESHQNGLGNKLCADTETYVNVGSTYNGKTNAGLLSAGYVYEGFTWDTDPEVAAPALPLKMNIAAKHHVVYRYSPNEYPVKVTYEYKDGTPLSGSQSEKIVHGRNFNQTSTPKLTVPAFNQKVLINWKLDGVLQNNSKPGLSNVTRYHDIILIYGQDKGGGGNDGNTPDGIEDFTITEKFTDNTNNTLAAERRRYVNKGTAYTGVPKKITGFTYHNYRIDGGAAAAGNPQLKSVAGDHEVLMIYGVSEYKVTVKAMTTTGKSIQKGAYDWTDTVKHQDSYSKKVPSIKNMLFKYWTLNGVKQSGSTVKIVSVAANADVKLYYNAVKSEGNKKDNKDYGNYEFVKTPNVKHVKPGQTVDYTFSGFGNKHPISLDNYSIADKPDKGLDFKGASLPAFTNGTGVSYTVTYYTNKQSNVTLHTGIPANKAFSFRAPKLAGGEYITMIIINFGTVPSGFGIGDTMNMTFKIWDDPPAKSLTNIGMLTYNVDGKAREFVSASGTGTVYLSGWFTAARTGDSNSVYYLYFLLLGSAGAIGALAFRRRKAK